MSSNSYLFTRPPLWQKPFRGSQPQLSAELQSWLSESGSLTKRLRAVYGQDLAVRILFHAWKPAFVDECQRLQVAHSRYLLLREVLLHIHGTPLVLARTVLPEQTIRIAQRNLSHLGTRPLGEVIFAYPDLERRQRDISCVKLPFWSPAIHAEFQPAPSTWGRRSLYAIHNQPLLVSEWFLPALFKLRG